MDFYSGKQPNLIGPIMKSTVCEVMKKQTVTNTISDRVSNIMGDFYKSYIFDNKIIIFIIVIGIACLIYRYHNKSSTKTNSANTNVEKFSNEESTLLKDIENYQTKHLIHDNPPHMNPTVPYIQQEDNFIVHHPPDPLPINIPNSGFIYTRNLYPDPPPFTQMNDTDYDHDNVYSYPSNSYYNGTHNTYQNAQDTDIINPYGWSNNFNTNTGNFVGNMTTANQQNVADYQTIVDNMKGNLIDSLKVGPYSNPSIYDNQIDPPYAI